MLNAAFYMPLLLRYMSPSIRDFILNHPILGNTVEFNQGIGTRFQNNTLKIGLNRKDWVLHELGHMVAASDEELFLPDYGLIVARQYSVQVLLLEIQVFRFQKIFAKICGNDKASYAKSFTYIKNQQIAHSLPNGSKADFELLHSKLKEALFSRVSKKEKVYALDNLEHKLVLLQRFNPNPIHFCTEMTPVTESPNTKIAA